MENMKKRKLSSKHKSVALVVSCYHYQYTSKMEMNAKQILNNCGIDVDVFYVPGSFEIPLQVQRVAAKNKYVAIVALGLIWQGSTLHAREILRVVTDSLMTISLQRDTPVIHEVLFVKNDREARQRCGGSYDRGKEAAEAVIHLIKGSMLV
jgi:6,7-dimethyl-8-ribityllumazine synthase